MWKRVKESFWTNLLLFLIAVFVLYGAFSMGRYAVGLAKESRQKQERVAELEAQKASLETKLAEFQQTEAIEREAKAKLNMKKEGEVVVVVPPLEATTTALTTPKTFRERVKDFFNSFF